MAYERAALWSLLFMAATGAVASAQEEKRSEPTPIPFGLYKQLEAVKNDRAALESFPAVLANPLVQQMRSELIALQRQQAQVAEKFGERHPNLIKAREQAQAADARLQAEVSMVLNSVRNEFAAAGVVLVMSADGTSLQAARTAVDQLDVARARILGAVLNRVDLERRAFYYAQHYGEEDERSYSRSATRSDMTRQRSAQLLRAGNQ